MKLKIVSLTEDEKKVLVKKYNVRPDLLEGEIDDTNIITFILLSLSLDGIKDEMLGSSRSRIDGSNSRTEVGNHQ